MIPLIPRNFQREVLCFMNKLEALATMDAIFGIT